MTERRLADAATRDAEQRYRAVFESSRDGKVIYALDVDPARVHTELFDFV